MKKIEAIIKPFKLDDLKEAFSGLGLHNGTVLRIYPLCMALTADLLINPDGSGMEHEGVQGAARGRAGMGRLGILFLVRIAAVANNAPILIA